MTIAKILKHDFSKGYLYLYNSNGNQIYHENSDGYWYKKEYDSNGNVTYFENSDGTIADNRPKPNCNGKTVTIEGVDYELKEKK